MGERETSGATSCLIVRYVRAHGGDEAVARVVARARAPYSIAELEDERHWISYEDKLALFEAASEILGDPHVSRHMGEAALEHRVGAGLRLLLRTLGSPRLVLANVAKACPKFSTVATMEALELHRERAVVAYRLDDGKRPHRLDCEYNMGLISVIGPLFGLPPLEIEHPACQVRGDERCIYRVQWPSRLRRLGRSRRLRQRQLHQQLAELATEVQSLRSTAADLVSSDDVSDVLARIVSRAASAVSAPRYLLAVERSGRVEIHHDGEWDDAVGAVAAELLEGRAAPDERRLVHEIVSARRRYGVIAAFYDQHTFFGYEAELLASYARSAAAALDAATALEEARRRAAETAALLQLSRALADLSDPTAVAQKLAEAMTPVLGAHASVVFIVEDGQLVVRAVHGWDDAGERRWADLAIDPADDALVREWLADPRPALVTARVGSPIARTLLDHLDLEAFAAVPIQRRGTLLGVAVAAFAPHTLPADTAPLFARISAVADQAATAIENGWLVARLRHEASHDALTGLASRGWFEEEVGRALERAARTDLPVSLLFLDLDDFKQVNDRFGHGAGDDVLREVARRLRDSARAGDVVARMGGDEFAVMLWDADDHAAVVIAARVRDALERPIVVGGCAVTVGASTGTATARGRAASYEALLQASDFSMYDHKRTSRRALAVAAAG
jgi:diguanylate cyclase (GGDEF)-like protein